MPNRSSQSRRRSVSRWRRNGGGSDSLAAMDWGAWLEGNGSRSAVGVADDAPTLLEDQAGDVSFSDWLGDTASGGIEIRDEWSGPLMDPDADQDGQELPVRRPRRPGDSKSEPPPA